MESHAAHNIDIITRVNKVGIAKEWEDISKYPHQNSVSSQIKILYHVVAFRPSVLKYHQSS